MRSAGFSLLALTLALSTPFAATWAQTEPESCTWENAEAISLYALERSGTTLSGRCVRVRGETDGWALRTWRRSGIVREETFVGAYVDDEALSASLRESPRRGEVLGVVGNCNDICAEENEHARREMTAARAEGRAPENIVICMARGFCHYYDGPYVRIAEIR